MVEINKAMTIIDCIPAPTQIIKIGPRATLGKLFKTVRYGSITLAKNLFHHIILAINIPIIVPKMKLINVSQTVIRI